MSTPKDAVLYQVGDRVCFAADTDVCGIVTGILFRADAIHYLVVWSDFEERAHQAVELTNGKEYVKP